MRAIGIDIGTTSICAVVIDLDRGALLHRRTVPNRFFLQGESWKSMQDADAIYDTVSGLLKELAGACPPLFCIGVTGQMHGVLFIDAAGSAVSPLYTWQDGRGSMRIEAGCSYADSLSKAAGYALASGYGMVTYAYNRAHGLIPDAARGICTIADYVVMKLTGAAAPLCHPSMAASLGLFDMAAQAFDLQAAAAIGLDAAFFPAVYTGGAPVGEMRGGIAVAAALGDNQASFLGAVREQARSILVNIGTGSQLAVLGGGLPPGAQLEARPFPGEEKLLVGSALCGGAAYAQLEQFFRAVCAMDGSGKNSLYAQMARLAEAELPPGSALQVSTRFAGTRADPVLRGGIANIGRDNLTPAHLVQGVLNGIVQELYAQFRTLPDVLRAQKDYLVGAGNGLRKNPALQRIFSQTFGMPLLIPRHEEEAAMGAALFALHGAASSLMWEDVQQLIQYQSSRQGE